MTGAALEVLGITVIILVGIIGLVVGMALVGKREPGGGAIAGVGAVLVILSLTWLTLTSFAGVPANEVGIMTKFGKYSGTLEPGGHWVAPWAKVDTLSTRVQTINRDNPNRVAIRFSGGGTADVVATIRYRVDKGSVRELWSKYRDLPTVEKNLVNSDANNSFQAAYGKYVPEKGIDGTAQDAIAREIVADVNRRLAGKGVAVDSIAVTAIDLDDATQGRINAIIAAQARGRVAEQDKATATQEALANANITRSLTPQILANKCLDLTADAVRNGKGLPATWTCFGGSNSGVLVGAR